MTVDSGPGDNATASSSKAGTTGVGGIGATTTSTTAAGGTATTTTSTMTATTGGGGGDCSTPCNSGLQCCQGVCVNKLNDIFNCGSCGTVCTGDHPYCKSGSCSAPPCAPSPPSCGATQFCCGNDCCKAGQLCCHLYGGGGFPAVCSDPYGKGTCPPGCPDCLSPAPTNPIATPAGERPIADLRAGDLVYSIDHGQLRAVRVLATKRRPVTHHRVTRIVLDSGRTILISPDHPLANGQSVRDIRAHDILHGVGVISAELVAYEFDATHDILPESDTGTYFAAGVLIGSTMFGSIRVADQCLALPVP